MPAPFAAHLTTWSERRPPAGWASALLARRPPTFSRGALAGARRNLGAVPSWRAPSSIGSYRSVSSIFSAGSLLSVGSFLSVGSVGSILSVGSAGSILSIGSSGSILSIGAAGGFAQIGSRRDDPADETDEPAVPLSAPATVRSIRPI